MPPEVKTHFYLAFAHVRAAASLGCALLLTPPAEWKLRAVMVYGVLGLIGFLAQKGGVAGRLLPIFAWLWAYAGSAYQVRPPSPQAMTGRDHRPWLLLANDQGAV
ncbi:MAG: hypothetical protein V3T81_02780 [Thermoanaerobaculia bacterium]